MRGRCLSAVGAVLAIALFTLAASPCTAVLRTVLENTASATLVIDAGHGGFDGGAVSERGVSEQAINLSVAQRVRAACLHFFGVQTAHDAARTRAHSTTTRRGRCARTRSRIFTAREQHRAEHLRRRCFCQHSSQQIQRSRSTTAHRCFTPRTAHVQGKPLAEAAPVSALICRLRPVETPQTG